jgi:hypothetical protein
MVGLPRNPVLLNRTFRHGKVFLSLGTGWIYVKVGARGFEPPASWSRITFLGLPKTPAKQSMV